MIFGGQARSPRATAIVVGAIIFLAVFIGLVYNHLDSWDLPTPKTVAPAPPAPADDVDVEDHVVVVPPATDKKPGDKPEEAEAPVEIKPAEKSAEEKAADEAARKFFLESIQRSYIDVNSPKYSPYGAFPWSLPSEPKWTKPLGKDLCIIDLDNRPFSEAHQLFGPNIMSWENADLVHGLSLGVLNHWLYAKIHGYTYYYVEIETYEDRRASWKKPPIMSEILKKHDACIYLDSDAIFHHLDLPFEWLMNYWEVHPTTNSLALAFDPTAENNMDKFGKVYLNTGFIIAQNNEKTYEVMDAWQNCPNDDSIHPECKEFRLNGPGRPTDQGGFGTFIRYDYAEDIKELPCTEANGFLESNSGCAGIFIKHLWTGKKDWIKVTVGEQLPGKFLELFHEQFLAEKDQYFFSEAELFEGKTHPKTDVQKAEAELRPEDKQ